MTSTSEPHTRQSNRGLVVVAVISGLLALASLAILGYLGVVLGDRGLVADATGTAGYTTPTEAAALTGSLIGLVLFTVLFIVLAVIAFRQRRMR